MKKSLLALATLTAFAGVASAQSSVTVFGRLDVAARNVKNGSVSLKTLSTNGMASSALGFRGVEDLGGGLRAAFHLEGDVSPDVGGGQKTAATANGSTGNGMDWQRRATVSLIGAFGEIRLGRDYTPDFFNYTVFDPYGHNGVASIGNFNNANGDTVGTAATTAVRANNAIGYFLPAGLGGLYGQVMVAAGENTVGNKHIGGRLGYAAGPVNVAVAYGKTEVTPVIDLKRVNFGASFNMGFMTLTGFYSQAKAAGGTTDGREMKHLMVGALVPFGASTLKFSYNKLDGSGKTAAENARDANGYGVGYLYSLSKRTTLYTHFSKISNKASAAFTASSGGVPQTTTGFNSTGYEFGISHAF